MERDWVGATSGWDPKTGDWQDGEGVDGILVGSVLVQSVTGVDWAYVVDVEVEAVQEVSVIVGVSWYCLEVLPLS